MIICSGGRTTRKVYKNILQNSLISESGYCNYGRIEPQRCKSLCGSLIYGVYLLRHSGGGAFHLFTPPPAICRTHDAAHDQGREVAPLMRHRTSRTSQRCGPAWTYAACRSRSESNGYRQHCGRVAAQYRLAAPKEESRCLWQWAKRPPESAASVAHTGGERLLCKAKGWGLVAKM